MSGENKTRDRSASIVNQPFQSFFGSPSLGVQDSASLFSKLKAAWSVDDYRRPRFVTCDYGLKVKLLECFWDKGIHLPFDQLITSDVSRGTNLLINFVVDDEVNTSTYHIIQKILKEQKVIETKKQVKTWTENLDRPFRYKQRNGKNPLLFDQKQLFHPHNLLALSLIARLAACERKILVLQKEMKNIKDDASQALKSYVERKEATSVVELRPVELTQDRMKEMKEEESERRAGYVKCMIEVVISGGVDKKKQAFSADILLEELNAIKKDHGHRIAEAEHHLVNIGLMFSVDKNALAAVSEWVKDDSTENVKIIQSLIGTIKDVNDSIIEICKKNGRDAVSKLWTDKSDGSIQVILQNRGEYLLKEVRSVAATMAALKAKFRAQKSECSGVETRKNALVALAPPLQQLIAADRKFIDSQLMMVRGFQEAMDLVGKAKIEVEKHISDVSADILHAPLVTLKTESTLLERKLSELESKKNKDKLSDIQADIFMGTLLIKNMRFYALSKKVVDQHEKFSECEKKMNDYKLKYRQLRLYRFNPPLQGDVKESVFSSSSEGVGDNLVQSQKHLIKRLKSKAFIPLMLDRTQENTFQEMEKENGKNKEVFTELKKSFGRDPDDSNRDPDDSNRDDSTIMINRAKELRTKGSQQGVGIGKTSLRVSEENLIAIYTLVTTSYGGVARFIKTRKSLIAFDAAWKEAGTDANKQRDILAFCISGSLKGNTNKTSLRVYLVEMILHSRIFVKDAERDLISKDFNAKAEEAIRKLYGMPQGQQKHASVAKSQQLDAELPSRRSVDASSSSAYPMPYYSVSDRTNKDAAFVGIDSKDDEKESAVAKVDMKKISIASINGQNDSADARQINVLTVKRAQMLYLLRSNTWWGRNIRHSDGRKQIKNKFLSKGQVSENSRALFDQSGRKHATSFRNTLLRELAYEKRQEAFEEVVGGESPSLAA